MNGEAETLAASELLKEIFAEIEREQVERAIYAKLDDDETRRASLGEVRAIRSVREKLEALIRQKTNPAPGAVA